jgi:hypothetical protein
VKRATAVQNSGILAFQARILIRAQNSAYPWKVLTRLSPGFRHVRLLVASSLSLAFAAAGCSAEQTGGRPSPAAGTSGASGASTSAGGALASSSGGSSGVSPAASGGSSFAEGGSSGSATAGNAGQSAASGNAGAAPAGAAGVAGSGVGGSSLGGSSNGGSGGEASPPDTSSELYDPERVPRFDLELPAESMAALERDSDTYVTGSLRYGTEVVSNIGVRVKGEGSLRTLQEKAAFKLKFDEFVSKQSFRGLRRLTLNNMVEDPSFLAERLAYHFYRAVGLPAPRCNSALVYVNGELFGVYANVETEDKTFLRRWFESDDGNLYEEGQVDFEPGNETEFDLETNEEANDRSDLTALIAAIASAQPDTWLEDVGAELDLPHFLAFTAAEAAVNQWDMYGYTVFYPNNFRLYRDLSQNRFVFLPWGMDMSMKPFRDSDKPFIEVFELSRVGDRPSGRVSAGLLLRRCLESAPCQAAYRDVVAETASLYEAAGLLALAEKYHAQIADHVAADPRKEYTAAESEAGYQSLLATIRGRAAALRADLGLRLTAPDG